MNITTAYHPTHTRAAAYPRRTYRQSSSVSVSPQFGGRRFGVVVLLGLMGLFGQACQPQTKKPLTPEKEYFQKQYWHYKNRADHYLNDDGTDKRIEVNHQPNILTVTQHNDEFGSNASTETLYELTLGSQIDDLIIHENSKQKSVSKQPNGTFVLTVNNEPQ